MSLSEIASAKDPFKTTEQTGARVLGYLLELYQSQHSLKISDPHIFSPIFMPVEEKGEQPLHIVSGVMITYLGIIRYQEKPLLPFMQPKEYITLKLARSEEPQNIAYEGRSASWNNFENTINNIRFALPGPTYKDIHTWIGIPGKVDLVPQTDPWTRWILIHAAIQTLYDVGVKDGWLKIALDKAR